MRVEDVKFESLEQLSPPTSVAMEEVIVEISEDNMFGDFAECFVAEARRINPLRFEQVGLTATEVRDYVKYLVSKRVESCNGDCPDWRKLKVLYIPAWIQYNLRMIGQVVLRDRGLKLVPVYNEEVITFEEANAVSEKIGSFEDCMQIVRDAMPRPKTGDIDVMSTALIAGYVKALHELSHPSFAYVTAFMGMKLKEEAAFKVLYRKEYDDFQYIRAALLAQKEVYR